MHAERPVSDPRLTWRKYESVQAVLNWFAVALLLTAWVILMAADEPIATPNLIIASTVPLFIQLFARRRKASAGARLLALALNWLAAVLVGVLAGAAFTGIAGTYALFPLLGCAALLYYWNAAELVLASLG
jgi:FtsH-binding integral membrane protein